MINGLVEFALRQRFMILIFSAAILVYGGYSLTRLKLDAFPDVTNIQVQINTEARGLAAEEVEKLITFPIESVMSGLPDVQEVRSISKTGLSVVTVVFDDDVDIYFARQLVLERLQIARERIPDGVGDPEMGPITTGLGQIFRYVLVGKGKSLTELRSINDWIVKFQLRTVPGVTDVLSFGGFTKQYHVLLDPRRLIKFKTSIAEVEEALVANNRNAGGWFIQRGPEQIVVRGVGLVRPNEAGLSDIGSIVLKAVDGTPVYLRDVASVKLGEEIRQGAVTMNGKGEIVMGVVLQLKGANSNEVISRVHEKMQAIQGSLPPGVEIKTIYDQSDLVGKAVETVSDALLEAAILIVIVLFLFLWNVRSALVVLASIPLSLMIAFIMMGWADLSANLQSLAGLAIGIGMMVDGSLVMTENIIRHLAEHKGESHSRLRIVLEAAKEVARPVFFAVLIIIVVFLPLFTLEGVEGKMFSPMALTIAFAMMGSLIVALCIIPALAFMGLGKNVTEKDSFLMKHLRRFYRPILGWAVGNRRMVVGISMLSLLVSLATVPFLGTEFVPELNEGSLAIRVTMNPSISIAESKSISGKLERKLLKYPEVTYAISQIGRPELGGDPEPISNNEIVVGLKPRSEWRSFDSRDDMINKLRTDMLEVPGIKLNFSQPIATRVDELLSGVRAQIAIKLFGDDLGVLQTRAADIEAAIRTIPGATDVQTEQISGEAQLVLTADREKLARYGLNVDQVMTVVRVAIGGEAVGEVIEGQRRFALYLRMAKEFRNDIDSIGRLWVRAPSGAVVPISEVAEIKVIEGPPTISREDALRRIVVQLNVRGRDMGGFVEEAREKIAQSVKLPPGYFIVWGGQFENQQRAQRTLLIVVPIALALIYLLLYLSFNSARNAFLIILNVPFAMIGGIISLAVTGQFLSVPSAVGFIALFGVAVLNGVVMVSYFNQLVRRGVPVDQAVVDGAMLRLRPVLMTATVASLGLIPLLLSSGIGSEVQRPLATVVVGGLISSTALTLLVLPAIYRWFAIGTEPREEANPATAADLKGETP